MQGPLHQAGCAWIVPGLPWDHTTTFWPLITWVQDGLLTGVGNTEKWINIGALNDPDGTDDGDGGVVR